MIGMNIKIARLKSKLTQSSLADRCHVSKQTISFIEREKMIPSLLLAMKISEELQVPIDELLAGEQRMYRGQK